MPKKSLKKSSSTGNIAAEDRNKADDEILEELEGQLGKEDTAQLMNELMNELSDDDIDDELEEIEKNIKRRGREGCLPMPKITQKKKVLNGKSIFDKTKS